MRPFFASFSSPYRFWNDPLDKIFTWLFVAGVVSTAYGYGKHFVIIVATLAMLLKLRAPNKKFPTAEKVSEGVDLSDKVVMITGTTSGIGVETARVMALRGAHVFMVSRNVNRLIKVKTCIETNVPGAKIDCIWCDLSDQDSVRKCAKEFLNMKLPLNSLICNAGIMALQKREETAQHLERQIGVNFIGHYLLLKLLTEKLIESSPARVVILSSSAHRFYTGDVLKHDKLETVPYEPWRAYGNSKMMNIMLARHFNWKYSGRGITAVCCNPGGIMTGLQKHVESWTLFKWMTIRTFFFKNIAQGAATTVYCATHPHVVNHGGKYFNNCKVSKLITKVIPSMADCVALCNAAEALILEKISRQC